MKRRILAYLDYIDALLERDDVDWENEAKKHLVQIGFFAHERLVHLIVLVLFALAAIITVLYLNFSGSMVIFALVIAIFVLLIPYINHYYLLENSVQRMYVQYDKMMEKQGEAFKL
jgi:hypothetical protein